MNPATNPESYRDAAAATLHLGVPGGWVVAVILVAIASIALVLGLRELSGAGTPGRLLGALRVASLTVAVLVALSPRWVARRYEARAGDRVVLLDVSRSMGVRGARGERAERARELLGRWAREAAEAHATLIAFGADTRPVDWGGLDDLPSDDSESRLAPALDELLQEDLDAHVGCVVVVSDGALEASERLRRIAHRSPRIYTVAVGADDELDDDALTEVAADPVAFLRDPAHVRVEVRSARGGTVPVVLRAGEELVAQADVEVAAGATETVELAFTPRSLGRAVYEVSIPVRPEDPIPENNARPFLVRVQRERLRVLLVAGRPSWDERFLRSFLKGDPGLDLVSFFILRGDDDESLAPAEEMALIPFPTDELFREQLGSFDVVILQNFDYGPHGMRSYLPRIRDYVRGGGALAVLGGDQTLGSAGYGESELGEILPTTLPAATSPESQRVVLGDFQPRLAAGLLRHPLLALGRTPEESRERWERLAPLQGANLLGAAKSGAQVLMRHPTARGADGSLSPLLAVWSVGRGRVLVLGSDSSFRWGFGSAGLTGDASAHERFWDRALRWLSHDLELEPVTLTTDRERYASAATITATGSVADRSYAPSAHARIVLEVRSFAGEPSGTVAGDTAEDGSFVLRLPAPRLEGAYSVSVRRSDEAEQLAEEAIVVESAGGELARPEARPELLRELARASGGAHYSAPERAPGLGEFDADRRREQGVSEWAPFEGVWAFALAACLLGADWIVRRRYGRR